MWVMYRLLCESRNQCGQSPFFAVQSERLSASVVSAGRRIRARPRGLRLSSQLVGLQGGHVFCDRSTHHELRRLHPQHRKCGSGIACDTNLAINAVGVRFLRFRLLYSRELTRLALPPTSVIVKASWTPADRANGHVHQRQASKKP